MSNDKTKEPATTGSSTPEPKIKKKRGRKPSKKQYFTADVDAAIKEYLASSNQDERNEIYRTRIAYAFYKLAENLIHTFKFYYTEVESLEDLKHEVCCFFLEKLDYFKPEKGSKAFSYFSIVGKNYLILYNNNNYKKKKAKTDPLAADKFGLLASFTALDLRCILSALEAFLGLTEGIEFVLLFHCSNSI